MTAEYGIRVRSDEGVTYVQQYGSLKTCQARIASWEPVKAWSMRPVEIVTRDVSAWRPVEES